MTHWFVLLKVTMVYKQLAALSKKGTPIVADPIFASFTAAKKDKKRKKDGGDKIDVSKKKRKSSPQRKQKTKK